VEYLNPKHELVLLGDLMNCSEINRSSLAQFASTTGGLTWPLRLVARLLYVKHAYNRSDVMA
jgi:hypothetical protein